MTVPPPVPSIAVLTDQITALTQALPNNVAFLAIAAPTNAQILAQVQALTNLCNALIRLHNSTL